MADRPASASCSEEQIQSVVRNIFGELFEAEQHGHSSGQHDSVASEINQRFRLPRNNINVSQNAISNSIPTRPASSNEWIPPPSVPQPLSAAVPLFNPQVNYGNNLNTGRSGPVRPRRSGTRRRSRTESATSQSSSERNEMFLKDVCLLPTATCEKVPRREVKAKLQKDGFYVDAFTFDKRWDEQTLRNKMLLLFSNVLHNGTR